ncbi:MAG: hypothetical protein ACYSSN_12750 [Planctomycetota bacterium]
MTTRRGFLLSALIAFSLALPRISNSQDAIRNNEFPDQEKRSCIQSVDGYAYLSENMTLAETRAAAFSNAKRQALEGAMTYVQSKTRVKNFQLDYDVVISLASGERLWCGRE